MWLYYTFGIALLYTNILLFLIKGLHFCFIKDNNINNNNNNNNNNNLHIDDIENNDRQLLLENEYLENEDLENNKNNQ